MKHEEPNLLATCLNIADDLKATEGFDLAIDDAGPEVAGLSHQLQDIAHIADFYRKVHMPLAVDLETGSAQHWSHLELMEVLGRGTFGIVYRALDPRLMREVALKVLPLDEQADQARALAEARRLASLKHPNIVTIFGAEIWQGQAGFWMELIIGRTLADLVATHGPMDAREAARIGTDLARALTAIHGAGLVHRDIKPANVMREYGGRTILMDLGTGAPLPGPDAGAETHQPCGTPMFCAPEILTGQPADTVADIYSLGVLLDHLVTGSYPITGNRLHEIKAALQSGRTSPLRNRRPDLDEGFLLIIEKATSLDPKNRYQSAGELTRALGQWQASSMDHEPPTANVVPSPKSTKKRALSVLVLVVGLVLAGILGRPFIQPASLQPIQAEATLYLGSLKPPRALSPGSLVQPGDRLFLDFTASRPLHVYLINEDDAGHAFVLFPLPGMDLENPLPGGKHRLPPSRRGQPYAWTVSSAGGQEHFLIAASRNPIPLLEDLLGEIPTAADNGQPNTPAYSLSPSQTARLRGVGVLLPDPDAATKDQPSGILEQVRAALAENSANQKNNIWIRRIDLANPR